MLIKVSVDEHIEKVPQKALEFLGGDCLNVSDEQEAEQIINDLTDRYQHLIDAELKGKGWSEEQIAEHRPRFIYMMQQED